MDPTSLNCCPFSILKWWHLKWDIWFNISTILKAPILTVVQRHIFTNTPSHLSQINSASSMHKTSTSGQWSRLTSRTSWSIVFNIEYKLYICIYEFCKIKNIIVSGRISTTGRGYDPNTTWRSCQAGPGTIKWAFLAEGMWADASSPYSSDTNPTPTCAVAIARPWRCFTACTHHRFRHRRMSRSSSRHSPCSSSPTCCPCPRSQPWADRHSPTRVRASRSCFWLFFVRVAVEDTMVPVMLRLSWRRRVHIWDIGQPKTVARQQSTYATELVLLLCHLGGSMARRHSHSLALFGLTPGACVSRFGAALTGLLSPLVCSLHVCI
jgi:hypothetical protein